jgi:predicted CoA-binding protein
MINWQENILKSHEQIRELLQQTKRIAVLGIKTEEQSNQPAFYVPQYMAGAGYEIVPVPVYYPEATQIMGRTVYRKLADVPGEIDLVNVFRRPADIAQHVDDILAKHPKAVWFQSGIRNEMAAEKFAQAGIKVVQDACLMVEHRALARKY